MTKKMKGKQVKVAAIKKERCETKSNGDAEEEDGRCVERGRRFSSVTEG
jgi:hypothetical protein